MECTIAIPVKNGHYTLYAEGVFIRKKFLDGRSFITLDGKFVIVLYYTVYEWRHLYVCIAKELLPDYEITFNECSMSLSVIADLTGRAYDRFKRSMDYLNKATGGMFYKLPPSFFWQLAWLSRHGKNDRLNIRRLVHKYDKNIRVPERIRWEKQEKQHTGKDICLNL